MAFCGPSHNAVRELAKALGLEGQLLTKIVLEFTADDVARVYVQGLVDKKSMPGIVTVCESLSVDDRGNVVYSPVKTEWITQYQKAKESGDDACHIIQE